ncbi:unnamed protein product [Candidula unifasciata]|uniref:Uncharacterized protein n=1 Tax=Candidula unifasciata TaxID=100452 RepID=A0A8S3ZAH2_9EUPU|nr:unnamed protein product [Candidula unifasciata]
MAFLKLIFPFASQYLVENSPAGETTKANISQALEVLDLPANDKVVIVGPDRVEKTSLVFQAAVSSAASGIKTAYICTHPLRRLPTSIHGMVAPEPSVMKNVDFIYLEEASELIGWFAGAHTRTNFPGCIIVEDILTYASQLCDRNLERSLAKLCAIITDSVAWIASHTELKRCNVLLTAPSRIASLSNVLSLFHFTIATYEGPGKGMDSLLSYETDQCSVTVRFCRKKDVICMTSVHTSMLNKS